jgi:hypothetical protein
MSASATVQLRYTEPARAAASRSNAQHSTGPRTDAGKQRSSLNSLTHGLTARTAVLPSEDPAAYQQHCRQFFDEHKPATPTETQLVQNSPTPPGVSIASHCSKPICSPAPPILQTRNPPSHSISSTPTVCWPRSDSRPATLPPIPKDARSPPRDPIRAARARTS